MRERLDLHKSTTDTTQFLIFDVPAPVLHMKTSFANQLFRYKNRLCLQKPVKFNLIRILGPEPLVSFGHVIADQMIKRNGRLWRRGRSNNIMHTFVQEPLMSCTVAEISFFACPLTLAVASLPISGHQAYQWNKGLFYFRSW